MRAQEVQAALEGAGCARIACNAITANNGARALLRVAEAAGFALSKEQARMRLIWLFRVPVQLPSMPYTVRTPQTMLKL
jgi:hypothetical protein